MNKKLRYLILFLILFAAYKDAQAEKPVVLPKGRIPVVYRNHHIYIPANINDSIPGHFVFDTGASNLSFDSTFFAHAPFPIFNFTKGRVRGVGTGGYQRVHYIIDTLNFTFGEYSYRTTNIYIQNDKSGFGDFCDGFIGQRYFCKNKYLVEINYANEYMVLHNDTSMIDLSKYTRIDMDLKNNRFFVPLSIQVNDTLYIQETFLLDLGFGGGLSLATPIAEKYNLSDLNIDKIRAVANFTGASGQSTSTYFRQMPLKSEDIN